MTYVTITPARLTALGCSPRTLRAATYLSCATPPSDARVVADNFIQQGVWAAPETRHCRGSVYDLARSHHGTMTMSMTARSHHGMHPSWQRGPPHTLRMLRPHPLGPSSGSP